MVIFNVFQFLIYKTTFCSIFFVFLDKKTFGLILRIGVWDLRNLVPCPSQKKLEPGSYHLLGLILFTWQPTKNKFVCNISFVHLVYNAQNKKYVQIVIYIKLKLITCLVKYCCPFKKLTPFIAIIAREFWPIYKRVATYFKFNFSNFRKRSIAQSN